MTHVSLSHEHPRGWRALTVLAAALAACASAPVLPAAPAQDLTLATTTSTADSGLLSAILPEFETAFHARVKVVAVGTGQALKLGEDGNADVVLVHARSLEDDFIAKGFGVHRRDVMYNDFVLVGPLADPAGVGGSSLAAEALARIARAGAPFASRGDKSGTNTKELELWTAARIVPQGTWYSALGQGMGETLRFASERGAYTLTDRATWLAQRKNLPGLRIVLGGERIENNPDRGLYNPYGVIPVNPVRYPQLKSALAESFAEWITSVDTQKRIQQFGADQFGQSLFRPDSAEWRGQKTGG